MRTIFEVRTAKDSKQTPEASQQLFSSLSNVLGSTFWERFQGTMPTITFEIASLNQRVYFIVTVDSEHAPLVKSQIAAQYPTAVITQMEDYLPLWANYGSPRTSQLGLAAPNYFPIRSYPKFDNTDPLAAILGVMGKTPQGSAAVIQLTLSQAPGNWTVPGRSLIKKGVSSDPEVFKSHPQQALIEEKIAFRGFATSINLFATHADPNSAQNLISQISSSFGPFALNEANSFRLVGVRNQNALLQSMIERSARYTPKKQILNIVELASIYHFPGEELADLRNIAWGKTIKGEAPDNLPTLETLPPGERKELTVFAKTEFKNQLTEFGIKLTDRRRHFYVLGKSGTGKSTLLGNMAVADMRNGKGFAIIDPHGDLVEETLLDYVPQDRLQDVVYLDPSDLDNPFHLNPLKAKKNEYKDLTVSNIMSIFTKIWANVWSARMEYILRNTLATLVEVEGTTMLDIPTLLTDKKFRTALLQKVDPVVNRVIHDFWEREYNQYNDRFQQEAIAPILNKVGQFLASPTIRSILRQPDSTIDVEDMMNSGKIVLLNLSQGRIGEENAALLGAMFITQFQLAAMNRINIPESERKDFFLYVDEFQNFATTSFVKILAEARKYRLGLILANQYTAQLPEEIQKAIFGNIGTIVTFVMGADDANTMMQEFGELYTQEDLVNLGKHQIITKLSIDDRISAPFPAYTLPPVEGKSNLKLQVIEKSRNLYTRPLSTAPAPDSYGADSSPQPASMNIPPEERLGLPPEIKPEVGGIYEGTVSNIKDYGIFVEIAPEIQGLVHVSNMSKEFISNPSELFKKGDQVKVKLYQIDDQGRYNLTMILDDDKSKQDNSPNKKQNQPQPSQPKPQEEPKQVQAKPGDHAAPTPPNESDVTLSKKEGYIPTSILCLIRDNRVLLAYKKEHNLWHLPQSSIEEGSTIEDSLIKKTQDKLDLKLSPTNIKGFVGENKLEFTQKPNQPITNKGKLYYAYAIDAQNLHLNSTGSYDQLEWVDYEKARKLVSQNSSGSKLQITYDFLQQLKEQGYIN